MKYFVAIFVALFFLPWANAASTGQSNFVVRWNSTTLQGVRDSNLDAPMATRALALVHTCMYDAWAAYDERAVETQLGGALRRPTAEQTLAGCPTLCDFQRVGAERVEAEGTSGSLEGLCPATDGMNVFYPPFPKPGKGGAASVGMSPKKRMEEKGWAAGRAIIFTENSEEK